MKISHNLSTKEKHKTNPKVTFCGKNIWYCPFFKYLNKANFGQIPLAGAKIALPRGGGGSDFTIFCLSVRI